MEDVNLENRATLERKSKLIKTCRISGASNQVLTFSNTKLSYAASKIGKWKIAV